LIDNLTCELASGDCQSRAPIEKEGIQNEMTLLLERVSHL